MTEKFNYRRYVPYLVWGLAFIAACWFLHRFHAFHFYFIEQEHLFLYDADYIQSTLFRIGGLAGLAADYLVQYYCIPLTGAVVTSALSVLSGLLLYFSFRKSGATTCILPALIPVAVLVFSSYDEAFHPDVLTGLLFMSTAIFGFASVRSGAPRFVYASCATVVLFFAAGPAAALFSVCILVWGLATEPSRFIQYLIPIALLVILVILGLRCQWFGEFRHILLPDGYYISLMHPEPWIYATWWSFPLAISLALCSRLLGSGKVPSIILAAVCTAALAATGLYVHARSSRASDFYKELDYYMYQGKPDKVIEACRGRKLDNYICRNILNWALAENGTLADEAFHYPQHGPQSLILDFLKIPYTATLLSNIYYSIGHIALCQRMAFESNVSYDNSNPRMLMRLVETNLIYGNREVADKYISRLKKSKFYKEWASSIEDDSTLDDLRLCLPANNSLSGLEGGLAEDFLRIAEANPDHREAVQYAGIYYLSTKDLDSFASMLDRYYGTEVLPSLPKHFQEAVLIYTEQDSDLRARFDITEETCMRYEEFKNYFSANRKKPNIRSEMGRKYGDTYWFYFLY